jgi:hypothetical protein
MRIRVLISAWAGAALLAVVPAAPAAPVKGCAAKVLREWRSGAISMNYAPSCYRTALTNLPEDIRIYSSAQEDISRALHARLTALASNRKGDRVLAGHAQRPLSEASKVAALGAIRASAADHKIPIPVLVAGAAALLLVGLASASRLARKLRR